MKTRGDGVTVVADEGAIWYRCTCSPPFCSFFDFMVHDLLLGSNEQYSWNPFRMKPKVHVLNLNATILLRQVQQEGFLCDLIFEFIGEKDDLFPILHPVDAWNETIEQVRPQVAFAPTVMEYQYKHFCMIGRDKLVPVTMILGRLIMLVLEDNAMVNTQG